MLSNFVKKARFLPEKDDFRYGIRRCVTFQISQFLYQIMNLSSFDCLKYAENNHLMNASFVLSNTTETTFTPTLFPAITRPLLLPHFWHNYYKE